MSLELDPSQTESEPLPKPKLSERWQWGSRQPISFLMQQGVENPNVISLAAGLVDPATLPVSEMQAATQEILASDARARNALQYGTTQGAEALREQVRLHFSQLEGCAPDDLNLDRSRIMLTTGSQQLLSLVCEILLDPDDIVFVSSPTYFVFLGNINGVGAQTVSVKSDEHGMNMDDLEAHLERLEAEGKLDRVKLIYLVSYFENPSGISLSAERRERAVKIARKWSKHHRIHILEDAAYRELRYDGPVDPSVWSFDPTGDTVILTQTFSKTFSPGLRVGFGILPPDLVPAMCDRKGNEDFGSANFNQHLLARIMQQGVYAKHIEQVCAGYTAKRDAMLAAAEKYCGPLPGVSWVRPHGGLYVWMSVPEHIETGFDSPLFHEAVKTQKVMYVPGELCYAGPIPSRPRNQMRLSFGVQDAAGVTEGIARLARAIESVM